MRRFFEVPDDEGLDWAWTPLTKSKSCCLAAKTTTFRQLPEQNAHTREPREKLTHRDHVALDLDHVVLGRTSDESTRPEALGRS